MEFIRLCAAWALAAAGLYLLARGSLALVSTIVIRWAANLLGQHQGGQILDHGEAL